MFSNGFKINECDKCVYIKHTPNAYVIVCLYVDDMLIMGNSHEMLLNTKRMLTKHFDMKDMSVSNVILGIKISRTQDEIVLAQSHYIEKVLKKFDVFEESPVRTPLDPSMYLVKNVGESISQLRYSQIIDSLM